ncbi:uncharacterized protein [Typha latifolia]|uniref:uncharacterized protein n=1 Tax=Typha latifolia TaxID=4733 RepID=UPI003C2B78E2
MANFFESFQKRRLLPTMALSEDLPISQSNTKEGTGTHLIGLRKRIQPISSASMEWAFQRPKSMPSIGEFTGGSLRKWWDWSWSWVLSRKPGFAQDLEMNEEESAVLGSHNRGSLMHLFYKVRLEIRKLVGSNKLPTTHKYRHDAFTYAKMSTVGR